MLSEISQVVIDELPPLIAIVEPVPVSFRAPFDRYFGRYSLSGRRLCSVAWGGRMAGRTERCRTGDVGSRRAGYWY